MITNIDVEKALDYLIKTSNDYAKWKSRAKMLEYKLKVIEAQESLEVETGSQEYKKNMARVSDNYKKCLEDFEEANFEYLKLESLRRAADLKVSYAQTVMRANMQGTII